VCWGIVVKEKPAVGSPFLGVFPSDRIPEVMKDVIVHSFIDSCTYRDEFMIIPTDPCKLYQ